MGNLESFRPERIDRRTIYIRGKPINLMKIADKMGTTPSMLSRIFAGNVNGSLKTIRKLAEVLDLPLGTTVQAIDAWKARSKDGEAA